MTDTIYAWSQTAIDNATADASINWAEFQDPDTVNDSARAMMRRLAQFIADVSPTRSSTGSSNAYLVTSAAAGAAYRNGEIVSFVANFTNTGAATLNVNSRGAKPIRAYSGTSLNSGEIRSGQVVTAFYFSGGDEFLVLNSGASLNAMTEGLLTQSIVGRLPRVGDPLLSLAATPRTGTIRLTETTQAVLKSSYPELNSWASAQSYPWGSTATHFNLPPAAGYFMRFAATSSSIDTGGARTAGSTQTDQNKTHTHTLSAHTHAGSSLTATAAAVSAHTHTGTVDSGGIDHTHPISITSGSESVGHTHAISITSSGQSASHSHTVSGSTDAAGSHSHTYSQPQTGGNTGSGAEISAGTPATGNTSTAPDHSHTFSVTSGGNSVDHTHLVSGTSADRSVAHTHLVSGTSGTTSAYLHTHTFTTASNGAHTHTVTMSGSTGAPSTDVTGSSGADEVRVKNVAFHVDIIASSALLTGTLGMFGFAYAFDSGTTAANPGTGRIRWNSSVLASVTSLYVSETDAWGADVSSVLGAFGANAVLKVSVVGAPANFLVVQVSGSVTDSGAYRTVPVTVVASGGTFTAEDSVALEWTAQGAAGATGTSGIRWNFESSTTMAAPASGGVRLNNATLSSVTQIALSAKNGETGNPSVLALLQAWDDSSTTGNRATLILSKSTAPQNFATFSLNAAITDNTTWVQLPVTYLSGSGSFSAADVVAIQWVRTGDKGTSGTGTGDLLAANNLSDLASAATARSNLGLMQEPGGRPTLTSATPVLTSAVTAQTTVYYAAYKHRFVPIYDGTKFVLSDVGGELSQATTDTTKSPAACTTNSNYDLFVWNDGGTYRCTRGPAWSSATSRGTGVGTSELTRVNGILVNANAITNGPAANRGTYVGTIRTNGSSQIDHTNSAIGIWSMYHRMLKPLFATDSTNSWTYTTATFREANGGSTVGTSRVAILNGLSEDMVEATAIGVSVNAFNANTASGIGIDSSSTNSAQVSGESTDNNLNDVVAIYRGFPGLGYHTIHWLEYSLAAGTTTWWGDNGGTYHQTGLMCTVMC